MKFLKVKLFYKIIFTKIVKKLRGTKFYTSSTSYTIHKEDCTELILFLNNFVAIFKLKYVDLFG